MPETQTSVLAHRSSKRSFNPKPKIIMGSPQNEVFIRFMVILQNPNYKNQAKGVFSLRFIEIRETRSDIIPFERSFPGWFIHILRNRPETNETQVSQGKTRETRAAAQRLLGIRLFGRKANSQSRTPSPEVNGSRCEF